MKFGVLTAAALLITSAALGQSLAKSPNESQKRSRNAAGLRVVDGGIRTVDVFEVSDKSVVTAQRGPVAQGDPCITFTSAVGAGQSPFGYFPLSIHAVQPFAIGDDAIVNFTVPAFTFGGITYTTIGVCSNGYVVIGGGDPADVRFINASIPNTGPPNNILAPFWTDLNPALAGALRIAVLTAGGDRWVVVDWEGVQNFGDATTNSFQVWIGLLGDANPLEDISFTYGPVGNGDSGFLTVGAENACGSNGTQVYFNGAGTLPVNGTEVGIGPAIDINCVDCNNDCVDDTVDPGTDCNNNGVPDECDIAGNTSQDCNLNGIPDECDTASDLFSGDFTLCEGAFVLVWPGTLSVTAGTMLPFDFQQCGNQFSTQGLWGVYRPAWSGTAFMGIVAQSTPIMISVFDDCPAGGGMQIACNSPNPNGVTFNVQRGHTYYLRYGAVGIPTFPVSFNARLVGPRSLVSANDYNFNGVPDECDCLFDVNHDNVVDVMDFLDARQNEGMCMAYPCSGDVDGDGYVDEDDYMLILNNLGPCQFPRAATLGESPRPARK